MPVEPEALAGDLPAWFVRVCAFMFGALWGSFFNVCIYRWPRGMSVVRPPSHCPSCGAPVRWYLNLPIFGYLLLRGRARCCGAKLTSRYAWVELLSAVLCLALAERYVVQTPEQTLVAASVILGLYFAFIGALLISTFVDLEWMEIPDEASLGGTALALMTVSVRGADAAEAALGAGLGYLFIAGFCVWLYEAITGRPGMGEGDAKLLMMIGAFLGWRAVLFCIFAASVQGLVTAGIGMATGARLTPIRPDEAPGGVDPSPSPPSEAEAGGSIGPGAGASGAQDEDERQPTMMVFGPMLALSALEFLFFQEPLLELFASWTGLPG